MVKAIDQMGVLKGEGGEEEEREYDKEWISNFSGDFRGRFLRLDVFFFFFFFFHFFFFFFFVIVLYFILFYFFLF